MANEMAPRQWSADSPSQWSRSRDDCVAKHTLWLTAVLWNWCPVTAKSLMTNLRLSSQRPSCKSNVELSSITSGSFSHDFSLSFPDELLKWFLAPSDGCCCCIFVRRSASWRVFQMPFTCTSSWERLWPCWPGYHPKMPLEEDSARLVRLWSLPFSAQWSSLTSK